MFWIGLDVGTGGSRALVLDSAGHVHAAVTAPHREMRMERPLWAEQDPEDWWAASRQAIRQALTQARLTGADVSGIGLSGQMHGLVLLDSAYRVIRPSLIWCDQRSQAQVDWVHNTLGRDNVVRWTANPVITGFTLPKLLWVRDHEPENFRRIHRILLPKDYVRFRLTGECATDVSDASGTSLFDVVNRRWSSEMAAGAGVNPDWLPRAYESPEISGAVTASVAEPLGLKPGTPVVGGAGDQAASAVGNGIVQPGIVSCTLGTSGVVFAYTDSPTYDPQGRVHTFCHAVPGKWHVMGVTQGAGLSLQWFRNQLAPGADYAELTREAQQAPVGARGLFWLPYLMGERTPHLDASARAAWVGLTAAHTRADLIRALLEGVCFSQKDGLEIIESLRVPVESVRISGGGARSPFWRQLMADVLGKPVVLLESEEGSAYGAALLALAGTGPDRSVEQVCAAVVRERERLEPQSDSAAYARLHRLYQQLYPALRPLFPQLH